MLIDFFYTLRSAKLPVSVKEYLALIEAVQAGVVGPLSDGAYAIDDFYYLSRTALVKDEKHYDKFDRALTIDPDAREAKIGKAEVALQAEGAERLAAAVLAAVGTPDAIAARTRAMQAGRRYPNLVDNMWAATHVAPGPLPTDESEE